MINIDIKLITHLQRFLSKIVSFIYRKCLPNKMRKIVFPLVDLINSHVNRIYSLLTDIYPTIRLIQKKGPCNAMNPTLLTAGSGRDSAFLSDLLFQTEPEIMKEARRQGMITMEQDGILKVLKGITTIEEVLRVAEEK